MNVEQKLLTNAELDCRTFHTLVDVGRSIVQHSHHPRPTPDMEDLNKSLTPVAESKRFWYH